MRDKIVETILPKILTLVAVVSGQYIEGKDKSEEIGDAIDNILLAVEELIKKEKQK